MKLYNGECLEVMDLMIKEGIKVDAIITDPPYGTTAFKWDSVIPFDVMWERLNKLIKPNGAIVLFGSEPFSSALRMSNIKNYKYDWIWKKNTPTGQILAKRQPLKDHEDIMIFYSKQCLYNRQMVRRSEEEYKKAYRKNATVQGNSKHLTNGKTKREHPSAEDQWYKNPVRILNYNIDRKRNGKCHPTQKPVVLMEYLIKTYTNEGETVLDFTMGSGSTGVACKNLNRDFIGIELDKGYYDIAVDRIKNTQKDML